MGHTKNDLWSLDMPIANFPANLAIAIQQGYLEKRFQMSLMAELGYRGLASKEMFVNQIGETITKTRPGLLAPVTAALNPASITNLDDGLSPTSWTVEQYTLAINEYAATMDLNIVANKVGIADQFLKNAFNLGEQARRSLDLFVRNTLLNAYMGGNTRVTVTLGAPGLTIAVDDIRGFQFVIPTSGAFQGKQVPVSGSATMAVQVGSNIYTLNAATADVVNVSSVAAIGGISGTLTFTTNVTVLDGTAGNPVVSAFAPTIIRPNNRTTTANLVAGDYLTLDILRSAVTVLRNNSVPDIDGNYMCVISPTSFQQLYRDPEFQILFRGTEFKSQEYRNFWFSQALGLSIIVTNLAPLQTFGSLTVQRPIVCGRDVAIEAVFEGMTEVMNEQSYGMEIHDIVRQDDVLMVTRTPLDRLRQIVAQSWFFVGGWTAPTDQTANPTTIPTATNAYYKRAVLIETV